MLNKQDMIHDLSAIWSTVKWIFPYFNKVDIDWDELYLDYLSKLEDIETEADFHNLLSDFMNALQDGHTRYASPQDREKHKLDVKKAPTYLYEEDTYTLTISLYDFAEDYSTFVRDLILTYNPKLVRIDVSHNSGGSSAFANRVAQLFIQGKYPVYLMWQQYHIPQLEARHSQIATYSREFLRLSLEQGILTNDDMKNNDKWRNHTWYNSSIVHFGSEDNITLYDGPIEILISRDTVSAAEDFAAMFKASKRGELIGSNTYGSTGSPYIIPMRCGGHAQVVSVGYELVTGEKFIGCGIAPTK